MVLALLVGTFKSLEIALYALLAICLVTNQVGKVFKEAFDFTYCILICHLNDTFVMTTLFLGKITHLCFFFFFTLFSSIPISFILVNYTQLAVCTEFFSILSYLGCYKLLV